MLTHSLTHSPGAIRNIEVPRSEATAPSAAYVPAPRTAPFAPVCSATSARQAEGGGPGR